MRVTSVPSLSMRNTEARVTISNAIDEAAVQVKVQFGGGQTFCPNAKPDVRSITDRKPTDFIALAPLAMRGRFSTCPMCASSASFTWSSLLRQHPYPPAIAKPVGRSCALNRSVVIRAGSGADPALTAKRRVGEVAAGGVGRVRQALRRSRWGGLRLPFLRPRGLAMSYRNI